MTTCGYDHGGPPLPPVPTRLYGVTGRTDVTPISRLMGAVLSHCEGCETAHTEALAADPLMVCHYLGTAWYAITQAFLEASAPVPTPYALDREYGWPTSTIWIALSRGQFVEALAFSRIATLVERITAAEKATEALDTLL